jgi:BirA family biotin operon repressor/biotin-[acetyl-CoA-carboxylase] ligase
VIDEVSHYHIVRLCSQGRLYRNSLGNGEANLLRALDLLGIGTRTGDQYIEIDSTIELINLEQIQTLIGNEKLVESFDWQYRLLTESTNIDVLKQSAAGCAPCIALAEMQTCGKGRRGRHWISPFAKNIYCTIGIPAVIAAPNLGLVSIAAGIALCKALTRIANTRVQLKWPNDIYYQNQKLGGILIESIPVTADKYYFAIGFGINVAMTTKDLESVPQAATSVNLLGGGAISRNLLLAEVISQVVKNIQGFDETSVSELIEQFNHHDAFYHQRIRVTTTSQTIDGLNRGINHNGQLELDTEQGRQQFSAAEISLRGVD